MAELDTEDFRLIAHERAGEVIKLRAEIEQLREALGDAITTLDLVWNHWNEIGYDSKKIDERVRAILSHSDAGQADD